MASPTLPGVSRSPWGRFAHRARWWWRERDWRLFVRAVPAVAAALGLLVLTFATPSPRELQARYLAQGKAAMAAKEYPRAVTCYERAAAGSDDPEPLYRLALAADAAGDRPRAAALMRGLAPDGPGTDDRPGYAPAHYWWARALLAGSGSADRAAAARLQARAEGHLVRALEGDLGADRPAALGLLGKLYLAGGRLDDAERCLLQAAPSVPLVRLELAALYTVQKKPDRARQEAELAARHFRPLAQADLDNHPARLAWARAVAYQDDFPASVAILAEALTATRLDLYKVALAETHANWHDARKAVGAAPGELLGLLAKGLEFDPGSRALLDRLSAHLQVGGADAGPARDALRNLLAQGTPAAAHVHFALAADARLRNDPKAEQLHLEAALKADPKAAAVANNLAFTLIQGDAPDLERALALVNVALAQNPKSATYLDTRGHVHLKAGRWADARTDFEAVLGLEPKAEGVHAVLATVYDKLGQPDQAAAYRRQAEALRKPPAKP